MHGPLGSYEADGDTSVSFEGDFTTQCAMVDVRCEPGVLLTFQMNNKLRYRPQRVQPVPREAALNYYTSYPIKDHVQSLPPAVTTIISVGGEPLWTSTKEVADTEEILVKDLSWPKRHVGRCAVLSETSKLTSRPIDSLPNSHSLPSTRGNIVVCHHRCCHCYRADASVWWRIRSQ